MFLGPSQFAAAFEDIKQSSLSHSTCKLVIFASCLNIDAICASKILTSILKKNLISFQLVPIVGYSELKNKMKIIDYDVTNVILLGCGAMIDLESFLEVEPKDYVEETEDGVKVRRKIYVIDGHRPWNLDNIFGSQIVQCFNEGATETELRDEMKAYDVLINVDSDDDLVDDEEEDDEPVLDRDELENDDEVKTDDDNDLEESLADGNTESRKRRSPSSSQSKSKRKRFVNQNEKVVEKYYSSGTTVSTSIALQMYILLSSIGETNIEFLWLTVVGTVSLMQQYPKVYDTIYPVLRDEVIRLQSSTKGQSRNSDSDQLKIEQDYSLFLLRHWDLYNAFFYSNFVNSKLLLYTNDGKKNLNKLFAKMGISLNSANQSWSYLDIHLKRKLPQIFKKYLKLYDLEGLIQDGFIRSYGYKGDISANEFVESITALLEYNESVRHGGSSNSAKARNAAANAAAAAAAGDDDNLAKLIEQREAQYVTNFWKSFDALNSFDIVSKGLKIAKWQQKLIFDKGFEIFEKRMMKNLRVFRLVVLKDDVMMNLSLHKDTDEDAKNFYSGRFFQNPLILTKLGHWLLECCAEIDNSNLPLIIASLDVETDTYLVCGLSPSGSSKKNSMDGVDDDNEDDQDDEEGLNPEQKDQARINKFSLSFQKVVSTSTIAAKIDSFEGSIITIKREDLSPFLEKLCSV